MHRLTTLLFAIIFVTAVMAVVPGSPAQAGVVNLPGSWFANVTYCTDGFTVHVTGTLATATSTTVSVLSASHPSQTGEVLSFTGPGSVDETAFFAWTSPITAGTGVTLVLDRSENGASLTGGVGRDDAGVVGDCIALPLPYAGPPLPPPGERNLVLVMSDAPILDAAGGSSTGDMLKMCQTAFIIGQSGNYGEVYVMGGWIDMAHTVDVAEDYGQPNGAPIYPGCMGS